MATGSGWLHRRRDALIEHLLLFRKLSQPRSEHQNRLVRRIWGIWDVSSVDQRPDQCDKLKLLLATVTPPQVSDGCGVETGRDGG
jgi:hypothetical protein